MKQAPPEPRATWSTPKLELLGANHQTWSGIEAQLDESGAFDTGASVGGRG